MLLQIQAHSDDLPKITSKTNFDDILAWAKTADKTPIFRPDPKSAAAANPAVARCAEAYSQTLQAYLAKGLDRWQSGKQAKIAYREAMPPLSGQENIRDFIACVAYAMLHELLSSSEGTRLLYAAQVAFSTRDARPHRPTHGKRSKTEQETAQTAPWSPSSDTQVQENQ